LSDPAILPDVFDPRAIEAARRLHAAGYEAVFAGGAIRDLLLGRPAKDVDIATNAHPDAVASLFPGSKFIGKSFGVTLVPVREQWFEIATFRRDIGSRDGRHPESVAFATAEEDAKRRDFTINGLFYDPIRLRLIDHVGGQTDLKQRNIRAIGSPSERFREDHLRMLRAVRFASVLEFEIEPGTLESIRQDASSIARISMERILDELTRTWTESPRPGRGLRLLEGSGLLAILLPEVAALRGVAQPPEFHPEGDVFTHTALAMDALERPDAILAWATLLHDIGKPATYVEEPGEHGARIRFPNHAARGAEMADALLRRLRASNDLRENVVLAVRQHMRFVDWPQMKTSTRRRWMAHPLFPTELQLHRADCLACHAKLDTYAQASAALESWKNEPRLPAPWISGGDLMAIGLREGPEIGIWRRRAFDAQLEGTFSSREELLDWLRGAISRTPDGEGP
jgi:poly(A) polymerase